jgi:formate dehydrogenase major subunit
MRNPPAPGAEPCPGRFGHGSPARPDPYQHVTDAGVRRRVAAVWGVEPRRLPASGVRRCSTPRWTGGFGRCTYGRRHRPDEPGQRHGRAAVAACNLVVMLEIPEQDSSARRYGPTGRLLLGKGRHFRQLDRHFQRVRPALPPPRQARTDFDIIDAVASSLALNSAAQTGSCS